MICAFCLFISCAPCPHRCLHPRYAIESGRFDVFKNSEAEDGSENKIAEMTNGQTFGELALLYGAKRSATVGLLSMQEMEKVAN